MKIFCILYVVTENAYIIGDFPLISKVQSVSFIQIYFSSKNLLVVKMPNIVIVRPEYTVPSPKNRTFNGFLIELGRMFKKDDLKELKFALDDVIPPGQSEKITEPIDVFIALKQLELLGPDKLDVLREYLEVLHRPNLIQMVDDYADAGTKFPLRPRSENRLEKDGYSVSIKGGRHFETTEGEFVEVTSGSHYALEFKNRNTNRCEVKVQIDGYEMFPSGLVMGPQEQVTLERPSRVSEKFKFFATRDAPERSGINKWRQHVNGLLQVKFTPEKADMKITCAVAGSESQTISCSAGITDVDFLKMVSGLFNGAVVTVIINKWKPLGQRGAKLVDYGIHDGSRVDVNVGGIGGVKMYTGLGSSINKSGPSKKIVGWIAGATTLEDESDQKIVKVKGFPLDHSLDVTLNLRLVARENAIPLPSTGNSTPLTRATLIPPPVHN
jgi:hypothetical protein